MAQYIDKDTLVAEIEKRQKEVLAYLNLRKEHGDYHADLMHDWIKSLKDRVQPLG